MKEVIIKVYTIDELAEEAKKYAIDNARCSVAECLNDSPGSEGGRSCAASSGEARINLLCRPIT